MTMTDHSVDAGKGKTSTQYESMLKAAGLEPEEELVYCFLIRAGSGDRARIGHETGLTETQTSRSLASLEAKGLITPSPSPDLSYFAAPPELALEPLIQDRQKELDQARLAARDLSRAFTESSPPGSARDILEVVHGTAAVRERLNQVVRAASTEFSVFVRPPFQGPGPNTPRPDKPEKTVRCRVIHDQEAMAVPGYANFIANGLLTNELVGELPRIARDVPLKLAIADRRLALVELGSAAEGHGALLIRASPMLNALALLFEMYWERSVPFGKQVAAVEGERETYLGPAHPFSDDEMRLLTLLSGGLTDKAIAREIGVGLSTITRRLRRVMDALGATSRFQAGLMLGEKGWLREGKGD